MISSAFFNINDKSFTVFSASFSGYTCIKDKLIWIIIDIIIIIIIIIIINHSLTKRYISTQLSENKPQVRIPYRAGLGLTISPHFRPLSLTLRTDRKPGSLLVNYSVNIFWPGFSCNQAAGGAKAKQHRTAQHINDP